MRIVVRPQRVTHCAGRLLIHPLGEKHANESITNYIQFQALTNWVHKHLLSDAGTREVDYALEEARRKNPDLTRVEAEEAIRRAQAGPGEGPGGGQDEWQEISAAIDWNMVNMEEQAANQARDAAELVKAALQQGIIQPKDIELYRRPPPEIDRRAKQAYENRITDLETQLNDLRTQTQKEIAELKRASLPASQGRPPTGEEIEELYNDFESAFNNRLGRRPRPNEYTKFVACVEAAPTLSEAKSECKRIIDILAPVAALPTAPETAVVGPLPDWFEHWARQQQFAVEREKYLAERPKPAEAPIMLLVRNLKTGRTERIKFWTEDSKNQYVKMLGKSFESQVISDSFTGEESGV